jgi:hypothetical protein
MNAPDSAAKLDRLLAILNDRSDTKDGPDGEPMANEAMSILWEYEGWLAGWIK